jgi:hypothetical protein
LKEAKPSSPAADIAAASGACNTFYASLHRRAEAEEAIAARRCAEEAIGEYIVSFLLTCTNYV